MYIAMYVYIYLYIDIYIYTHTYIYVYIYIYIYKNPVSLQVLEGPCALNEAMQGSMRLICAPASEHELGFRARFTWWELLGVSSFLSHTIWMFTGEMFRVEG